MKKLMLTLTHAKSLVHRACRAAVRFAEALKDALTELRPNTGIALSLLGKCAWLIPLLVVPHLFQTFPSYYKEFARGGPEWCWATLMLALITLDAQALIHKKYLLQMAALFFSMMLWYFLGAMAAQGAPRGYLGLWGTPGSWTWGIAAVGCLAGLVYTGQREYASKTADDFLVWRKFVIEEEARGAEWLKAQKAIGEKSEMQRNEIHKSEIHRSEFAGQG